MFADDLDRASWLTQQTTDDAVEEQRRRAAPEQVQNEDGTWPHAECVDCDSEIPEARLALGRVRCVVCQEVLERREKQYGAR